MLRKVYDFDTRDTRSRGRLRKCWEDGLREALARKDLKIEDERIRNRSAWHNVWVINRGIMKYN